MQLPHAKLSCLCHQLSCAATGVFRAALDQPILQVRRTPAFLPGRQPISSGEQNRHDFAEQCSPLTHAACRSRPGPQPQSLARPPCKNAECRCGRTTLAVQMPRKSRAEQLHHHTSTKHTSNRQILSARHLCRAPAGRSLENRPHRRVSRVCPTLKQHASTSAIALAPSSPQKVPQELRMRQKGVPVTNSFPHPTISTS
jgi:hypothetical protein